jgi:hypothetical protein
METKDFLSEAYGGVLRTLEHTLEGLTREDINWQPKPDCNNIGWLVWHPTRWQDVQISSLIGEEQLWIKDGWHKKFGKPADPKDTGSGDKPADLAKFRFPDAKTLLGYHRAVLERTQKYFKTLKKADLDRVIEDTPYQPPPTLGASLIGTLGDSLEHAGQAGYVRGLRQGYGWQPW